MKELSLLKYLLIKKISIRKPLQMSGYLKKSKISCFLRKNLVIYQLTFLVPALPDTVLFRLLLPPFACG